MSDPAIHPSDETPDDRPHVPPPDPRTDDEALATPVTPTEEPAPYTNLFGPDDVRSERDSDVSDADADADDLDIDEVDALDEDEEPATPARRPRLPWIIGGLVLLALIGGGGGYYFLRMSGSGNIEQPVARVGTSTITRGAFVRSWTEGQDPKTALDDLINLELVVQAAQKEGVAVDEPAVDTQIKELREQQGTTDAAFAAFLKQHNIASETELRTLLEHQQLLQKMLLKHTPVEQARARHILLEARDADALTKRKPEADDLLKQLQGGADFVKLASEKSDDPGSKQKGGELGWAPHGVFVPEFDQAIFSMKAGEMRLVQSSFGWHIIQLEDAPVVRPLDDNKFFQTQAVMDAFNKEFLPWVKGLRADADKQGQVSILVQPTELVPVPTPAQPAETTAPGGQAAPSGTAAPQGTAQP